MAARLPQPCYKVMVSGVVYRHLLCFTMQGATGTFDIPSFTIDKQQKFFRLNRLFVFVYTAPGNTCNKKRSTRKTETIANLCALQSVYH